MLIRKKLPQYAYLMRLDKPIGILLLLWPTLWALWLATAGHPDTKIVLIFVTGVILMRSAGCIFNDFADRKFDAHVQRTRNRPLASGKVKPIEALFLGSMIGIGAFLLVLQCNLFTVQLACVGAILALVYPFLKRVTHLPQIGLGVAFSWGIPMAFAAETAQINGSAWLLFAAGMIWPIIYDTMYAMVDREDDIRIGVKSTAIFFQQKDILIIAWLQVFFLLMMFAIGIIFQLKLFYYLSLVAVGILFLYQQWLIKDRHAQKCFQAFLNNNWVGFFIFLGIYLSAL